MARQPASRQIARTLVALLASLVVPVPVTATDAGTDGDSARSPGEVSAVVQELSERIESPFCPGKTLAMCPSGGAAEVRRDIQEMARAGRSPDEIEETIIRTYGEEYRREPPEESDNWVLLGLVVLGLLVCLGALFWFVRSDDSDDEESASDEATDDERDWDDRDEAYLEEIRDEVSE